MNWSTYNDQSNRKVIVEYLTFKYMNHLNFSNNNSNFISNKLHELIDYQENILQRFDNKTQQIESHDSLESSSCSLIPSKSITIKPSNEQTPWITESEETIDSTKTPPYLWNIDRNRITTITLCSTLKRNRQDINKDIHEALHQFNKFNSPEQKYAFIHNEKFIYAIGEYKTRMFKYDIISKRVQFIDGPYPSRSQFGVAATINHIILIGGLNINRKSISSTILFDCKQEQWYSLSNIPLRHQQGVFLSGVCFINHDLIIIIGGLIMTSQGPIAMRKCFCLNINKRKWLSIASCNEARGHSIVTYCLDRVYTIGGLQYVYDKYKRMECINIISIEQFVTHK